MTDVLVNKTKREDKPAEKKESKSMENSKLQTLEKIRPELNLEKWSIWQPSHSGNKKTRILKRVSITQDGKSVTSEVTIGYVDRIGTLTTDDQKVYYTLIKIWENAGKPTGPFFFSLRKIAKLLRLKWGTRTIDFLTKSLTRLRAIPLIWVNSYYDGNKKGTIEILDTFNILSDLKIIKQARDGVVNKEAGYSKFNDYQLNNLLNNNKPLFFEIATSFKSEIAQLLYGRIDLIMADKFHYERRTKELFEDLGLEGETYKNKSKRKEKLETAFKELLGVFLSTGILIEAHLELTKDGKDYKVVFKKQPFAKSEELTNGVGDKEEKKEPVSLILPQVDTQALELVKHFHEKLGRPNYEPSSKELDQATALLAECGFDKAKQVIKHAVSEAQTTNFNMRTFGAIFQYKSEALRLYERQQGEQEILKQEQVIAEQEKKEQAEQRRREKEELDDFYNSLTQTQKEKCQILTEQEFKKMFCPTNDPASPWYQSLQETARYNALRVLKQDSSILD